MTTSADSIDRNRALMAILLAAAVCGTADILYAMGMAYVRSGVPPERVLQSVASGLLGRGAYAGGSSTAALGLALHFGIMTVMAATYVVASLRLPLLRSQAVRWGFAYGLATFAVMNYVVIPLSAIGHFPPITPARVTSALLAHVVLVGLPIAFIANRMGRNG